MEERDRADAPKSRRADRDPAAEPYDRLLLEGVRRRDAAALGRFFDAAFPFVYNLAFRLSGDHTLAEDVTQEVFLKVHRAADRIDMDRSPQPWLTAITVNTYRDTVRRASTRREQATEGSALNGFAHPARKPDEELAAKEREHLLERALRELDEAHRTVVILYDFCGRSHDDIAKLVGASHAAVRKRYSRALGMMRDFLRKWQK